MSSFLNRVFGKNSQSSSPASFSSSPVAGKRGAPPGAPSTTSSTPTLISLDLPPWIPPELNRDNIRLLVFSDSDDSGLELIFDSKTLRIVPSPDQESINNKPATAGTNRPNASRPSPISNPTSRPPPGPSSIGSSGVAAGSRFRPTLTRFTHRGKQYELMKSSNDIRNYADYIFGTMPLLFKGTGMKVHTSKLPLQIMMSRVFALKQPERSETAANISTTSEPESAPINPLNPFAALQIHRSMSSGVSIASSTISSIDVLSEDLTNQKFGRLYRRWLKCANRSMRQPKKEPGRRHRRCIGVAFIVTFPLNETQKYKHFEEFFCTHAPLIENHFQKIMSAAELNINDRNAVAAALLEKLMNFKDELYTLYTRPRLLFPAWYLLTQEHLTMSRRRTLALQLCSIIDQFTTPKYGDFLNCVLSAVLSYQLSWLSTVSPSLVKSKQQMPFKSKADYTNAFQSFLQYSPLWGQLIDMFSAYGQPPYICRTVLVGSDANLLTRLLYLLSFFIRPSYLTYRSPNVNLCDTDDDQNRSYRKIRLYIDELIANSLPIQDIDSYSPVQSVHSGDAEPDDFDVLSADESAMHNHLANSTALAESTNFYQLTFTSDDLENSSVEEQDISQLLDSLVERIEQILLTEQLQASQTPVRSTDRTDASLPLSTTAVPNKTLMSLSLFEPNHLGHESLAMAYDYHLDLALSLISSVASSYSSDFILQAIETSNSAEILRAVLTQHNFDTSENGCLFLNDEPIDASITILINLDDVSVNIYSSKHKDIPRRQERTKLIQPLIDHAHLARQLLPADFVLLNMEDSLQEIYFQALAILKYIRVNSRSIRSHESVSSFGDSASTTSAASGDTDDKRSRATNHTVTDFPIPTLINPNSVFETSFASSIDHSSELVQNILRKFQLQRSDYMFLKNILRILEIEQREMNG